MSPGSRPAALTPYGLAELPASLAGGVVAIGNFDGVHRGHAALLESTRELAGRQRVPAVVLTFEPHPRWVLKPDRPLFRLTPLPAKARVLGALGLDGLAVAHFDRAFAEKSAADFVAEVLVGRLRPRGLVVGYDFHFGKNRQGTPGVLTDAGKRLGFEVSVFGEVANAAGEPLSSSAIRSHLADGAVEAANRLLGYRWFVQGPVIPGDRRGRELGFPTANIDPGPDCRLRHGIYAVRLLRADGTLLDGVASFGRRPTFGAGRPLLEVFLFDFSGDLYGEEVAVNFVAWIRPELAFASVGDLVTAMNGDSAVARTALRDAAGGTALDRRLGQEPQG